MRPNPALLPIALLSVALLHACTPQTRPATVGAIAGPVLDVTVPARPADLAAKTTLDEKLGIGATNAYTAASKLGTALARAGLIDRNAFKAADQRGYDAIQALRLAYLAGNARTYQDAISQAFAAAASIAALTK